MSFLHKDMKVSARFLRNGYYGSMVWDGFDPVHGSFLEIAKHVKVNIGDTIVTTSFSDMFPEGVMVGTVDKVDPNSGDNFQVIKVKLLPILQCFPCFYIVDDLHKKKTGFRSNTTEWSLKSWKLFPLSVPVAIQVLVLNHIQWRDILIPMCMCYSFCYFPWKPKVVVTCSGIDYRTYHRHVWKHQWDACCSFCVCGLCPTGNSPAHCSTRRIWRETSLTPQVMGINWFITYVSILVLLHHLVYFTGSIPVQRVLITLLKAVFNSAITVIIILLGQYLFEDPQKEMNVSSGRQTVIYFIFFCRVDLPDAPFFYIQVIDDSYKSSADNVQRLVVEYPSRGTDHDRNGELLVYNEPVYDLMIIPGQAKNILDSPELVDWSKLPGRLHWEIQKSKIVFSGETFCFSKTNYRLKPMQPLQEKFRCSRAFCFAAYASQNILPYCSAFIRIHWWGRQFNHQKKSILQGWWLYREKWNWTGLWIKVERTKRKSSCDGGCFNRQLHGW